MAGRYRYLEQNSSLTAQKIRKHSIDYLTKQFRQLDRLQKHPQQFKQRAVLWDRILHSFKAKQSIKKAPQQEDSTIQPGGSQRSSAKNTEQSRGWKWKVNRESGKPRTPGIEGSGENGKLGNWEGKARKWPEKQSSGKPAGRMSNEEM
jgi:hypothetical protein